MKKAILSFGMMLFVLFAVRAQETATQPAKTADNPNAPEITFTKLVHDYGTVYKEGDGSCEFSFTNTGKEPLILSNVRSSCGCTVPTWPREPILPGKTGSIKVQYDTKRIGMINKSITVTSNAKNATVVLNIKGNVVEKPGENPAVKTNDPGSVPQPH